LPYLAAGWGSGPAGEDKTHAIWQAGVGAPADLARFDAALAAVGLSGSSVPEPSSLLLIAAASMVARLSASGRSRKNRPKFAGTLAMSNHLKRSPRQ
jgi:hypothetical protein